MHYWKKLSFLLFLFSYMLVIIILFKFLSSNNIKKCKEYNSPEDFVGFDNETGTEDGCEIVPNYVHFVRYNKPEFSFTEAICVLAAFKNQKPDLLFFHTNTEFSGKFWHYLLSQKGFPEIVRIVPSLLPREIYGQQLSTKWSSFHASDITRLRIMMKYGGIYLDNDCFIVKSLKPFFKYEITMGMQEGEWLQTQVIVANKNARFLRMCISLYKGAYNETLWYYNAGERPTAEILDENPQFIHRMKNYFNDYNGILEFLYAQRNETWKDHYVFHILSRHVFMIGDANSNEVFPEGINEENIKNYSITFHDMVASVYPI